MARRVAFVEADPQLKINNMMSDDLCFLRGRAEPLTCRLSTGVYQPIVYTIVAPSEVMTFQDALGEWWLAANMKAEERIKRPTGAR